ncbi:mediator of RNA polymerase II transcription subunit 15-like isoform X3 [Tigriopus californicus]|uniref:mediator of RNA polymerase II transcription subunit 15-like isoform X3 n=1 Tax=Tigriopus californicus TaxID=6832 RepID=UPI0027DA1A01|nr:mediator of RNA polymerase II transcription subunit 15-like isoform X3 [Tigriopus californicus]
MKLSLLTTVSLYLFAIHLIFATNGLGLRPQSSMKRLRRLLSPQPRYPLLLPPIRGHQESRDANKTPSFGGGNGGGNGGGRTRKRGHRTISPRKRTRPSLKKSLQQQQQQQQQQQKHQQKNANENRLPYEHILRARYRDYEDRERRNQKLRLLAEENDKKKKKKALLQKESESLNSQYHHGNYPNPNRQTYQDTAQPALTQDDQGLSYPEFDPYAVPIPPRGQNMMPLSKGPRYQFQPQPVLPEPMPFTDSSEADTYPNAPERDDDPYPYQEREPQSSKGFSPPRGFQAEAFNPGYQPTGFKDEAPGHYSLDPPPPTSTNAKRKHFNIHRHNQKPKHVSYNVKNQFQGGGYEESSPLPAVPSSLIGHRPDMNKQALVTEAPESALRWVDSKFIHNQHGTFTNQVLTEFVNTLNQVQEKARSLGDMNRAEVQLNPNGRNHFSPLNDWSNYHKQFTFLVNDNVDAEMPIDHEEAGQSYRRSDQSPDYDYEDKPEDKRRYSPQERSTGITARSDPGYERHHHREEEVEPFTSDPLPPPGNPVYDGYTKIDQLYRSNYWD